MDYIAKAKEDAWTTALEFVDEMVEQYKDGEISDDMNNDYIHGDSYHHERHIDATYNLREAAELLDQLSDHEETDNGLWEGLELRDAISAQAAYTYGNAVYSEWRDIVEALNDTLDGFEFEETEDVEAYNRAFIKILVYLENYKESGKAELLFEGAIRDVKNLNFTSTLVLSDWLEENTEHFSVITKEFRELIAATKKVVEVAHKDDSE